MSGHSLTLLARRLDGEDGWKLCSPGVGLVRGLPELGARLSTGEPCGALEILGVLHPLLLPAEVAGQVTVVESGNHRRQAVAYGQTLLVLKPRVHDEDSLSPSDMETAEGQGQFLRAPQAGRFYTCPDPGAPPFIQVGDTLEVGRTVGLLEVMKTFSPIKYAQVDGSPSRAKVKAILVEDRTDVEEGTPLLELEA